MLLGALRSLTAFSNRKLLTNSITTYSKKMMYVNRLLISTNNQKKIKVGEFMINYESVGCGSHVVFCLPGALGTIDTDFRPQLTGLDQSQFTIVAWDPPGYGFSRPPDRDFRGGAQMFYRDAATAGQLMKELRHDSYSLIGWSDGGVTALIMAAIFPESIRKMILIGAYAFLDEKVTAANKSLQDIDAWSLRMRTMMIDTYGEEYFRKTWYESCQVAIDMFERGEGDICKTELPKIKCPTLIVQGLADAMVNLELAEYLKENITNSRLHIFDDGKHNLHLRHFKKFNHLAEEFLLEDDDQK